MASSPDAMRVRVLGSAAGGGLPQWNCGCAQCARARAGELAPRSQPSIALSADGARWSLLNASPDVRQQLASFPALHPRPGTRDLPLDTVILTNADLDHALGLLVLRESLPHRIVSTPWVRDALLEHGTPFRLLAPAWGVAKLDQPIRLDRDGHLEARFFPVPGKVPSWLAGLASNHPEATSALRVSDARSGRRLVYAPGVARLDAGTLAELEAADLCFVDGTFFSQDELARTRPGAPDARAMGHLPILESLPILSALAKPAGSAAAKPSGSSAAQPAGSTGPRCLYTHVNNTNPVLDPESPEAAQVRRAGLEVAMDGQELAL
jgi:pyrroloquinoline quinone biosynthesis protein B